MPPRAFQFTENCGMLTLPPSPYETELVETLITGILGFGIVMVIFSKADLTAWAAAWAFVWTVLARLLMALSALLWAVLHPESNAPLTSLARPVAAAVTVPALLLIPVLNAVVLAVPAVVKLLSRPAVFTAIPEVSKL